eukprot:TRINITY_DN29197_c0_g1_i1.p3 TRINITY_DN29197_c0_g1~~TRINITY_DN29197_c0_g1_i1.p3  ORF type:complete len:203 (+),score=30.34 TRINITY_DN29197_c0_g1_i1:65-673(+)
MVGGARVLDRSDPDDAGIIHVFNDRSEFMFIATDLARLGLSPEQITEERRAWNAVRKARRAEHRASEKALELVDRNRRALDYELASAPPDPPAALVREVDLDNLKAAVEEKASILSPVLPLISEKEDDINDDERPFFWDELNKYKWILRRIRLGLDVEDRDMVWAAEVFEKSELWCALGGEEFRQALLEDSLVVRTAQRVVE